MEPNCESCYWFWSDYNYSQSACHNYMVLSLKSEKVDPYNCEFYDEKHKNMCRCRDYSVENICQDGDLE